MLKTYYVVDEADEKPEMILRMIPRHTDPLAAVKEVNDLNRDEPQPKWAIYKIQYTEPVRVEVVVVKDEKA